MKTVGKLCILDVHISIIQRIRTDYWASYINGEPVVVNHVHVHVQNIRITIVNFRRVFLLQTTHH